MFRPRERAFPGQDVPTFCRLRRGARVVTTVCSGGRLPASAPTTPRPPRRSAAFFPCPPSSAVAADSHCPPCPGCKRYWNSVRQSAVTRTVRVTVRLVPSLSLSRNCCERYWNSVRQSAVTRTVRVTVRLVPSLSLSRNCCERYWNSVRQSAVLQWYT